MRNALCFTCGRVEKNRGHQRETYVRLHEMGWRLVVVRGLKWPQCDRCVSKSQSR